MQLKGLVKLFTAALILISLYSLSFTFVVNGVEKKARAQAQREAKAMNPNATGKDLERLVEDQYDKITDSLQGETVMSFPKTTYLDAKSKELSLGLDLQGGMSVVLEVSLDDLIKSMSNKPNDPILNKAIADANAAKVNSQANFVTLFGEAYEKNNPNGKLALLFTKPSETEITLQSTNEEVLAKINRESKAAIRNIYNVLAERIDKFGVVQPNINLDETKAIITVELAGVRNPERVRDYLQATAKLQFFEVYDNQEFIQYLGNANQALARYLNGTEDEDSTTTTVAQADNTTDTASGDGSLASFLGGDDSTSAGGADSLEAQREEFQKNSPLLYTVLMPAVSQDGSSVINGPVVGQLRKQDTAKFNEYMRLDVVKNQFPNNVKLVYGAQSKDDRRNPNAPLVVYALKTEPGSKESKLEGEHVTKASMEFNPMNGQPEVTMDFDNAGKRIWAKMTEENTGKFVAVVMDDKVYSAPRVNGAIPNGRTSISGGFTIEEAKDLANILKSGKLDAPARIVQEQVVGPTLGAESIKAGSASLIISFIVIFFLMLVYYNTAGLIANIALILNIFFTFGVLAAWGATLTMPGIAGLVLTIGMAVDTNVIIFERIKEELALGKTHKQAVEDGYKRSYAPVLDGHITTLITAIILFIFGLGPVKGFATTQILGLLLSMFCGIMVSRLVTDMYMKKEGRHFKYFTGLSKSIFKKANFDFVGKRKITYGISVIVILAGIGSLFNGFHQGVEFSGGRSYTIQFDKTHKTEDVRKQLEPYFHEFPIVKTVGGANQLNITTSFLKTSNDKNAEAMVQDTLYTGLMKGGFIGNDVTVDEFKNDYIIFNTSVNPTISDDLVQGAKWATFLSLLAVAIYILMRFRRWQYSLGTLVALLHDVCVTLAVFSFLKDVVPFSLEIDQHFIAAILTVIGFSMNDTVIVFDRIREYFRKSPKEGSKSVINRAINDTLSRTIMTALTVFITVLILFIFGGEVTRGFAFAMMIGIATGTYSSIFVAAPVLVDMDKKDKLKNEVDRDAQIEELKNMA